MTCPHETTAAVEIGGHWGAPTEIVARLCVDCLERLPASWGCEDCEWYETQRLRDAAPQKRLGRPCSKHWRNVV